MRRCDVPIVPGGLVLSRAGRDAGRMFVILSRADERHLMLADGDLRKVARPKKKKIMHVALLPGSFPELEAKIAAGEAVADHELREAIGAYRQREEGR